MSKKGINIHKRKDGRWEGRYPKGRKTDGSLQYGYIYGKTYTETKQKLLDAATNTMQNTSASPKDKLRFCEILSMWMQHNKVRQKGSTIVKYQFIIDNHILPELGAIYVSQITATLINSFLQKKLEFGRMDKMGGLSPSYVSTITIILRSAIQFAIDEGLCLPLKSEIYKPCPQKPELSILNIEDQKALESYASTNLSSEKIGVMLSLHTGMRIGEVCALSWNDVDLKSKVLHVRHTISRIQDVSESMKKTRLILDTPKTKSSVRDIPIDNILWGILTEAKRNAKSRYVLSNTDQFVSPRTLEYRYHRLLNICGIPPVNYHALRHTFATRCIEAGVDVKSLSEMLGHANVSITLETYVHSSMQLKRTQLKKLETLFV